VKQIQFPPSGIDFEKIPVNYTVSSFSSLATLVLYRYIDIHGQGSALVSLIMTRCVLGSCFSGQIPESNENRQSGADTVEASSRIWLRRGEVAFKKLWKRPVKQGDESEKNAELAPRSCEDSNFDEGISSTYQPDEIDAGFSQDAGSAPTIVMEPECNMPETKAEPEPTPPINVEQNMSASLDTTLECSTSPALIEECSHSPSQGSSESSSTQSSTLSLKERLKAAKPLPSVLLPQNRTRQNFVDGYHLIGVDVAESLAEASSARGGAQVQVNSEGAVFFLFFADSADKGAAESVLVLKFTGTDIRTRSEYFANTLAKGLGVATPVTNLFVKGSNREYDGWSGLRGAVEALRLGSMTRARVAPSRSV